MNKKIAVMLLTMVIFLSGGSLVKAAESQTTALQVSYQIEDFDNKQHSDASNFFTGNAKIVVTQDRYIVTLDLNKEDVLSSLTINGQQLQLPAKTEAGHTPQVSFLVQDFSAPLEGQLQTSVAGQVKSVHFLMIFDTTELPQPAAAASSAAAIIPDSRTTTAPTSDSTMQSSQASAVLESESTKSSRLTSTVSATTGSSTFKATLGSAMAAKVFDKQEDAVVAQAESTQKEAPQTFAVTSASTLAKAAASSTGTSSQVVSTSTQQRQAPKQTDQQDGKKLFFILAIVGGLSIGVRTLLTNKQKF